MLIAQAMAFTLNVVVFVSDANYYFTAAIN